MRTAEDVLRDRGYDMTNIMGAKYIREPCSCGGRLIRFRKKNAGKHRFHQCSICPKKEAPAFAEKEA